jgi:hypothetical protein
MAGRKSVCRHRGKQAGGKKEQQKRSPGEKHIRGFDVPSTQIEFDDRNKALNGVVNRGHGKKRFGVCHEAM